MSPSAQAEFEKRDEMGLDKSPNLKTGAEARTFYNAWLGKVIFVQAPFLGWVSYLALRLLPAQAARLDAKFAFIVAHDLGWVFASVLIVLCMRIYLMINSNSARADARVDRPDQHIYKIMSAAKPLSEAPYVLMATTGSAGRFNRAQRAAYNADETLPLFIVNLVLVAAVFGPLAALIALLNLYGRAKFSDAYTNDQGKRGGGFMISAVSEYLAVGLVWVCALKSFIPALP